MEKCPSKVTPSKIDFDPSAIAVQYYFGDLSYWQLPAICVEALERGFDGRALRIIAGLVNPVETDIRAEDIDSAFREMGVNAPIPENEARLVLATNAVRKALSGESNLFDEATHIRIHLCHWEDVPVPLKPIVDLSAESQHAPEGEWDQLEKRLRDAMSNFLKARQ